MIIIKRFIFTLIFLVLTSFISYHFFQPLYQATEVIISFGLNLSDICYDNPLIWKFIKISFIFFNMFSNFIIINSIILRFHIFEKNITHVKPATGINNTTQLSKTNLQLLIGYNVSNNSKIYLPESGLYQNFLITGTIGTGKTSSAMYPFTEQLIKYNYLHPTKKLGILILDVKGNYFKQVKQFATKYHLEKDIIEIGLHSKIRYNPLHKPNLNPIVLANRL